jgi:aminocarboxymuconate-semialdehyde decarboxylase
MAQQGPTLHLCWSPSFATCEGRSGVRSELVRGATSRTRCIDVHCHVHVPAADELLAETEGFKRERELSARVWGADAAQKLAAAVKALLPKLTRPEERLADMDRQGIDLQVLSPSPVQYYYWTDREQAELLVNICNETIAQMCAHHPRKFVGFGHVALQHPDLAVRQVETGVRKYGLKGFEISSSVNGNELSDASLRPFWAKIAELDVPVFIHPLGSPLGVRLAAHYLGNVIGQPMETTIALSMMIFSGLFDEFPNLKVIAAHGGGYLPLYSGRSDHAHRVRGESKGCVHPPSEYLKRIFYDAIVFQPAALADLINRVGASQILLGTDYPFDMGEADPLSLLSLVKGLDEERCAAILGQNAVRLLNLQDPERYGTFKHE